MKDEIVDCGGIYEVHPGATRDGKENGRWCVVNAETGNVRSTHDDRDAAITEATELNEELSGGAL